MGVHGAWSALTWTDFALCMAGWGLVIFRQPVDGRLNPLGVLLIVVGTVGDLVYDAANHRLVAGMFDAGYLAWLIWLWWNRGGGGKLRKRLSKLKRRLSVRQPVPQGV